MRGQGGTREATPDRLSLGVENERAGAERDGRTCLVRSNSKQQSEIGENYFSLFSCPQVGSAILPVYVESTNCDEI